MPKRKPSRSRRYIRHFRIFYQVFFLVLFIWLLWLATSEFARVNFNFFYEIDPLLGFATAFAAGFFVTELVLSIVFALLTVIFGRFFCGFVCPIGSLSHLFSRLFRKPARTKRKGAYFLKYAVLAVVLAGALVTFNSAGILDPVVLFSKWVILFLFPTITEIGGWPLSGSVFPASWFVTALFLTVLLLNAVQYRFFCRILCPLGALLSLLSRHTLFTLKRNTDRCTQCRICETRCSGNCNPSGNLNYSECLLCLNCLIDCPEGGFSYTLNRDFETTRARIDLSRRQLISSVVASALLPAAFVISDEKARRLSLHHLRPRMLRPPGSEGEEAFLDLCIRCGNCMKTCPTNVIQPTLIEHGVDKIFTPVLNYKVSYCEYYCNTCSESCPTGAIKPYEVAERVNSKEFNIGGAVINTDHCLPWAFEKNCLMCEEVCPTKPKAINHHGKKLKSPYVVADRCVGCGACENICPVTPPAIYVTTRNESRNPQKRIFLADDSPK